METQQLKPIIEESFTQYAGATIQSRALVDVRDGLKPSARQIFYSMLQHKLTSDKPHKKTMNAVGMAMADYYIHGDSSCTGIIMRAGQSFAMRYPLVDVKGNGGSLIESGNYAAPRYTESRLSKLASVLFEDIDKEVISEWRENYDNTKQYPAVLPTKGFYNITDIKTFTLDYDYIKSVKENIEEVTIDLFETDRITGDVLVKDNNSYLVTSLPYDEGFKIKIDDKYVQTEMINKAFLGAPISKGKHLIEITYDTPWLKEGKIMSASGLALFGVVIIIDIIKKRKK